MKRILVLLLFLFSASWSAAETSGYRIVHPDGTVEFTDDASRGGEEIKLRDVQTIAVPDDEGEGNDEGRRRKSDEKPEKKERSFSGYQRISISSPHPEQTIWSTGSGVTVSVSIDPLLQPGHTVVVSLDGSEKARGGSTSVTIAEVYRGTHSVSASVIDQQGNNLISSSPVTFYLRQKSK